MEVPASPVNIVRQKWFGKLWICKLRGKTKILTVFPRGSARLCPQSCKKCLKPSKCIVYSPLYFGASQHLSLSLTSAKIQINPGETYQVPNMANLQWLGYHLGRVWLGWVELGSVGAGRSTWKHCHGQGLPSPFLARISQPWLWCSQCCLSMNGPI